MSETFKTGTTAIGDDRAMTPTRRIGTTSNLTDLMNVGKAVVGYFERAGITRVEQLTGRDPLEIYDTMCAVDGRGHDPCLLDTIMSAVDQANGNPARPWWTYTSHRKHVLQHPRTTPGSGRPHETCRISFVAFDAPVSGHRRPRHAATKEIIMSSTVLSLDGFVAGPNESLDNGLGDGGERLHEWALDVHADQLADREVMDDALTTGAVVAGRGTFEPAEGWGGDHHNGVSIFIFSRHRPAPEFAQ